VILCHANSKNNVNEKLIIYCCWCCSFPLPSDSKSWLHAWIKFYHRFSFIKLLITSILSKITNYKSYRSFFKKKQMRKYMCILKLKKIKIYVAWMKNNWYDFFIKMIFVIFGLRVVSYYHWQYILVEKPHFSTCLRRLKMFLATIFLSKNSRNKHF